MIKLNASYSKKVPVPGEEFSSQSFHCSMEVELSDKLEARDIQEKIHETFAMCRDAVETELHGAALKADAARQPIRVLPQAEAPQGGAVARKGSAKASNAQVKYLLDLATRQGISLSALNARVQKEYQAATVYDLSLVQAGAILDELKANGRRGERKAA